MSFLSSITSPPVLDNKGSVARDHLALERTYLAWLRTSLTLTSVGIALSQFFRLPKGWAEDDQIPIRPKASSYHPSFSSLEFQSLSFSSSSRFLNTNDGWEVNDLAKPLGSSFILIGILTLVFGTWRYFTVQAQLMRTSYVPSRLEAITITFLVGTLLSAVLAVILATPTPSSSNQSLQR